MMMKKKTKWQCYDAPIYDTVNAELQSFGEQINKESKFFPHKKFYQSRQVQRRLLRKERLGSNSYRQLMKNQKSFIECKLHVHTHTHGANDPYLDL